MSPGPATGDLRTRIFPSSGRGGRTAMAQQRGEETTRRLWDGLAFGNHLFPRRP
jgi:hypothetical protein